MGKVLKVLGIVFVVVVGGIVALLVWSHEKGEAVQADFYGLVTGGDPARLMEALHPSLQEKVDAPVLALWMDAVTTHLGRFEGLAASEFSTSSGTVNGVTKTESKGRVRFERGEAHSELALVDGQVVAFRLEADALPESWFRHAPEPALYAAAAKELLAALLAGRVADARALMHENLRAKMPEEELARGVEGLRQRLGGLVRVEEGEPTFEAREAPKLVLAYTVVCDRGTARATVGFEFTPWKGHLVAFDVQPE